MYCPRCGSNQGEELKFCTVCGSNLPVVRQATDLKVTGEKIDRNKPWFADMTLSDAESKRRKDELDHRRGISAEVRRHNEIKAGVITASLGLATSIFLAIFMQGLVISGSVSSEAAVILSRLWVAGVIPFFLGIALIFNGVFVSKRLAEITRRAAVRGLSLPEKDTNPLGVGSGETTEFIPSGFSVTEGTTKHLTTSEYKQ